MHNVKWRASTITLWIANNYFFIIHISSPDLYRKKYKLSTHWPEATKSIYAHELNEIHKFKNLKITKKSHKQYCTVYNFYFTVKCITAALCCSEKARERKRENNKLHVRIHLFAILNDIVTYPKREFGEYIYIYMYVICFD